jgi:hypothetical protein
MSTSTSRTQYRLRCNCGREILVDRAQAGLMVRCECGAELEVPTIRGLSRLEQVRSTQRSARLWGNRQAILVIGLAVAAVGLGGGLFRQLFPPPYPITREQVEGEVARQKQMIQQLPLDQTFQAWDELSAGMDTGELAALVNYRQQVAENRRWMLVMYGVGALGLVIAASGYLVRD